MRLKTRLVLVTTAFITLLTAVLCLIFMSELLRGRVSQAETANDVLAHEVLLSTRNALQQGVRNNTLLRTDEAGFEAAVAVTLRDDEALNQTINAIVLYSPTVQDVYVSGANGQVMVSSDPILFSQTVPQRNSFNALAGSSAVSQWKAVFGRPQVFEITLPLQRNGAPFLYIHIGIRSSLLRNAITPWLRDSAMVALASLVCAFFAAAILSSAALHPIEQISRRLDELSLRAGAQQQADSSSVDAVQRVTSTINRLDERLRSSEEQSTELASNLSQMLRTLRDGIMLLTSDGTIALASESVQNFLPQERSSAVGSSVYDLFPPDVMIGRDIHEALTSRTALVNHTSELEDGRLVEVSLDFSGIDTASDDAGFGVMLTLHDPTAQEEVEREIDLSRRLASIGRLTAGVGHEVKNPINAMVLHLELLRGKLENGSGAGAERHLEVLASEMARLDRVVQTLADFTRPIEPELREIPLRPLVDSVLQLLSVEAQSRKIVISVEERTPGVRTVSDGQMLHQALLNIVLNAMDAMLDGGQLDVRIAKDKNAAIVSVRDTGPGIPREILEKIFHLYFTTKPTGSGIGLAMTWRIVQMLGGSITVQTETQGDSAQHGTEFVVSLPLSHMPPGKPRVQEATV